MAELPDVEDSPGLLVVRRRDFKRARQPPHQPVAPRPTPVDQHPRVDLLQLRQLGQLPGPPGLPALLHRGARRRRRRLLPVPRRVHVDHQQDHPDRHQADRIQRQAPRLVRGRVPREVRIRQPAPRKGLPRLQVLHPRRVRVLGPSRESRIRNDRDAQGPLRRPAHVAPRRQARTTQDSPRELPVRGGGARDAVPRSRRSSGLLLEVQSP